MRPEPEQDPTLSIGAAAQSAQHTFAAGDLLCERFRIVRFIGRGGMGEVYEADDLELRERVALKTIRREIAGKEDMLARFRNEIQLARKVTHPNVCRIFDLARHGEISFLTMELLQGESLAARLRRGPMAVPEALPIVRQMAAGLAAAHRAGVVHRDFKSSNVMLVSNEEGSDGTPRAVITDFGLAHSAAAREDSEGKLTAAGDAIGTPAYMAPEQLEGGAATPATDIYALGEVLFEMVTANAPFTGPTPAVTMIKRLQEPPPSPRKYAPDLDPAWERAILKCLRRRPEERFSDALALLAALEPHPGKVKRTGWVLAAVGIVLLAMLSGIYFGRRQDGPQPPSIKVRRSVAVIGFRNLSGRGDFSWLSTALSEMLSTELAAGEKIRTIPGESIARMRLELALAEADSFGKETLSRIRRSIAADYVVVGSYVVLGQTLRVDMRLQDAVAGETITAVGDSGSEADLLTLVTRTGTRLREKLGVGSVSATEAASVRAATPVNPDAHRLYAEGLARLRVFEALAARDLLEQAAAADPQHPLIRSALSASWTALGYDAKAAASAKKALDLANMLDREDRLAVEGQYREAGKEWNKAIEVFRTLWDSYPDNLEYGLRLAAAQVDGGKAKDALESVARLRRLPQPLSDDARIDIAEALADDALSDYKRMLAASLQAAQKGSSQGARLLLARARLLEGRANWRLGSLKETVDATEAARGAYREVGDRVAEANALNQLAGVISLRGDLQGGDRMYREAIEVYRRAGNKSGLAHALNNYAINLKDQGDSAGARRMQEEALALRRETGDRLNEAVTLNNIAVTLFEEADLAGAKRLYQQALAISRDIGDKRNMVRAMLNTAIVLEQEGDLAGARKMHEESLAVRREIGDKRAIALALHNLGTVLFALGDLDGAARSNGEALQIDREMNNKRGVAYELTLMGLIRTKQGSLNEARKLYEEALAIRKTSGEKVTSAESRLNLAALSLEEGGFAEAESAARALLPEMRELKTPQLETSANLVVAEALLAQGKIREATLAVARAKALSAQRGFRTLRFDAAMAESKILAQTGASAQAARQLRRVIDEAAQCGYAGYRLEAGVELAEIEMKSARRDAARSRLQEIEREATAKGFGLLARKASTALTPQVR